MTSTAQPSSLATAFVTCRVRFNHQSGVCGGATCLRGICLGFVRDKDAGAHRLLDASWTVCYRSEVRAGLQLCHKCKRGQLQPPTSQLVAHSLPYETPSQPPNHHITRCRAQVTLTTARTRMVSAQLRPAWLSSRLGFCLFPSVYVLSGLTPEDCVFEWHYDGLFCEYCGGQPQESNSQ